MRSPTEIAGRNCWGQSTTYRCHRDYCCHRNSASSYVCDDILDY